MKTNVLIIGGGPAGIQSSRMIKTLSPDTEVTVLRPEDASVIYCAIPYSLEGLIPIEKIRKKDELVTGVGAKLIKERAEKIDFESKKVITEKGTNIEYEKLLIVTGANPFIPPIPGSTLKNIFTVKTEEDTKKIAEMLKKNPKKAVVIGAGSIGLELSTVLKSNGLEVHLVDMTNRPLPSLLDKDMTDELLRLIKEHGIISTFNTSVEGFEGTERVEGVKLSNGNIIKLEGNNDFVVVSVGVKARIELFKDTALKIGNYGIIVDEHMKTNIPDVYAAGDCTEFYSGIDKKLIGGALATNAVPMGKVAALNIIGKKASYPGFFNGAITTISGYRVGGTGFTEEFAKKRGYDVFTTYGETTSRFPMMPDARPIKVKLIWEKNSKRLLGGQVTGYEAVAERIDILTLSLQQGLDAEKLSELSYSAQPWQTFFPARNAIVQAALEAYLK